MPLCPNMDLNDEDIEALESLAKSELRCSKYAKVLLQNCEGYESYSLEKSNESHATPDITAQNETKEGILSY